MARDLVIERIMEALLSYSGDREDYLRGMAMEYYSANEQERQDMMPWVKKTILRYDLERLVR